MKRFLSIILVLTMILSMGCFSYADNETSSTSKIKYYDIPSDHWAISDIDFATSMGITNGYWDGTFRPYNSVTKEEAATMLYRALNAAGALKTDADYSAEYKELFDRNIIQNYARKYIAYFLKYGIINEAEVNSFTRGEANGMPASRSQIGVWTAKALGRNAVAINYVPYTDTNELLAAEYPYVDLLYRFGIMKGSLQLDNSLCFKPKDAVQRSEFCAVSNRVYKLVKEMDSVGSGGYYDVNKEVVCYSNSLANVVINKNAELIYNGEYVDSLDDLKASGAIVKMSSMALNGLDKVQLLVDDSEDVRTGTVVDVTALSYTLTRVGIETNGHVVYYIINSDTELPEGTIAFEYLDNEVQFNTNGVYILDLWI